MSRVLMFLSFAVSLQAQVRFHTPTTPTGEAARQGYQPSATKTEAKRIDWKFLDRTDVEVSDGVRNATIKYPAEIKALDSKRISILGFMAPWEKVNDLTTFMLMPGYVGCYFCNPPAVTQVILVEQRNPEKKKRPYVNEAIVVTGTLRLFTFASQHPAHQADFMYALDDAVVEVAKGK